jgi:uncharacterized protein YggL (DUF469 family)
VNKRLRKKKRVGEFTEYGFLWEIGLKGTYTDEQYIDLMGRTITWGLSKGIWVGGGGSHQAHGSSLVRMGGYAYAINPRGKKRLVVTKELKAEVVAYLNSLPETQAVVASKLEDVNTDDQKDWRAFNIEADRVLGPDGDRCCAGGYVGTGRFGARSCSVCHKPYVGATV